MSCQSSFRTSASTIVSPLKAGSLRAFSPSRAASEESISIAVTRPAASHGAPEEVDEFVEASLFDLLTTFSQFVSEEASRKLIHEVMKDEFTVEEKVNHLCGLLEKKETVNLTELVQAARSKQEVVVTFLALLEIIRKGQASVRQSRLFGTIVIQRNDHVMEAQPQSDGPGSGETGS